MSPTDWRDISSAPRDGRTILLYALQEPHEGIHADGLRILSGYWDRIDEAWCGTSSLWNGPFYQPTHWMPLRPPPDALKDGER